MPQPVPVTDQSVFTWSGRTRFLTAEISETSGLGTVTEEGHQGMVIVGHTTERVLFVVDREQTDREGDLLWWDLRPLDHATDRRLDLTVRLYND